MLGGVGLKQEQGRVILCQGRRGVPRFWVNYQAGWVRDDLGRGKKGKSLLWAGPGGLAMN